MDEQTRREVEEQLRQTEEAFAQMLAEAAVFTYEDDPDWADLRLRALRSQVQLRISRLKEARGCPRHDNAPRT
jgi:hypothetical protein